MKLIDFILVPLVVLVLLILNLFYEISMSMELIVILITATLQTINMNLKMNKHLTQMKKDYLYQINDMQTDKQLIESQLETVFNNIPFPLAMMNTYGRLVLINHGFYDFLEDKNRKNWNYYSSKIDSGVRLFLNETFLTEKAIVRNILFNERDYQCFSVPIYEKSSYAGCLLVFQDITIAADKERMQKRFIADASHELKTPIAAIKGMIEILNRPDFDDEEILKDFHIQIAKESSRLERIVSDLLQLSKLSTNSVLIQKQMCDVNAVLENVIKEIKSSNIGHIKISFESNLTSSKYIDGTKIHHVVSNLLKNACEHSDASEIHVLAREYGNKIEIVVKDNGVGIESKHIEHLFDRFYRVDSHRARTSGGSGLGLAITKSIVNAHEGTIEVRSQVNKGSEFIVNIPV